MLFDVIGSYERLEKIYRMYIASAFPLKNEALSQERNRLLSKPGVLSQTPLLETIPVYPSSGKTLADVADELAAFDPAYLNLHNLASGLFSPKIELYEHQWQGLYDTIINGKDIVVTTGTGSGKTETFLLPLLAQLGRELSEWTVAGVEPANRLWWQDANSKRVSQWQHVTRPAAVRALVLYPLNALVEDQLRRLRMTLDNPHIHNWLDADYGGNRITFGRYTGLTPLSGLPKADRVRQLRHELKRLTDAYDTIAHELTNTSSDEERERLQEALWFFANPNGGEMWSRWDMQDTPPDILITNYSMLNIMLMRRIEKSIFDDTRRWLAEDPLGDTDHPSRVFHLIVDELHAYRGTPGTEVAYILRLLFDRLGLSPDSPQLRILTTTASLTDTDDGRKFLREFFGRDNFSFIAEEQRTPPENAHEKLAEHKQFFADFSRSLKDQSSARMRPLDVSSSVAQTAIETLADSLYAGDDDADLTAEQKLGEALYYIEAHEALRDACRVENDTVRPTKVSDLDRILFKRDGNSEAIHGLLLALGLSKRETDGRSPQPVRGHLFFHNLLNLWACCNPDCTDDNCLPDKRSQNAPSIGALYASHRLSCSCGARVLDFVVCEVCGEVHLGGYKHEARGGYILTADEPNLEGIPDRISGEQNYGNYAVLWLAQDEQSPQTPSWQVQGIKRHWRRGRLNVATGHLRIGSGSPGQNEIAVWVYYMNGNDERVLSEPALPTKCPSCDADYRRRNNPSPLRNHRTGFQKACQVLAGGLMREMPDRDRKLRKLVLFSDSRQDAAKLAAGMERDHYRDVIRMALVQSLNSYWGNLAAFLRYRSRRAGIPDALETYNPQLFADVSHGTQPEDVEREKLFAAHDKELRAEARLWLLDEDSESASHRSEWMQLLQDYGGKIPLRHLIRNIYPYLLNMGINPGGISSTVQRNRQTNWHETFDWSQQPIQKIASNQRSSEQETLLERIDHAIVSEIMYAIFPHMARSLEGLGQGWVTYQSSLAPESSLHRLANTVIRQLGNRRWHSYADHIYSNNPEKKLAGFVRRYLEHMGFAEVDLIDELSPVLVQSNSGYVLNPDTLYIMPPVETEQGRQSGKRCPVCNAFYLQSTLNVCPECLEDLYDDENRQNYDYYTYLSEESGKPFRMNSEELTGQTDKEDRPLRQRRFQEIFIGDEKSLPEGIDLLSVTTTMEAGVDIGGLLAVLMANMPPRRFNYQQRVGRAGRRGTGVSLAVTFCRGRSHDDFYYQRPESMTGDAPPSPYVDMSSETILRRVIFKEVLRRAFDETNVRNTQEGDTGDSVHGEFGEAGYWETYRSEIRNWLHDPDNTDTLIRLLRSLTTETVWTQDSMFERHLLNEIRYNLIEEISEIAVADDRFSQRSLSERLANAGLLPMFGFPTRVRNLYTKWPRSGYPWPPPHGTVDRDLDIAISQFAPFSQTVKDKQIHTAAGVVSFRPRGNTVETLSGFIPSLPYENAKTGLCMHCQALVPEPDGTDPAPISGDGVLPQSTCPVCGEPQLQIIDAREPHDFFTNLQPDDFEGQFDWRPRSSRPTISFQTDHSFTQLHNARFTAAEDDVLSINDNGSDGGFVFQSAAIQDYRGNSVADAAAGAYAVELEDATMDRISLSGSSYRVALLSKRHTEILLVGMNQWQPGIYADPTTNEGRAAWYSFAFWLRTAAAALLDVDTDELRAGFRTFRTPDGRVAAEAFLSDSLENGAGYCRYLGQAHVFEELLQQVIPQGNTLAARWLSDEHRTCDTSCNHCLRDYGNLPYHGLLDWRLALDMVRLAYGDNPVDLTTQWRNNANYWQWTLAESNIIPTVLEKLGYGQPTSFGKLRGYVHQVQSKVQIEVHPLWHGDHPQVYEAREIAEGYHPEYSVGLLNPFRAIRRPSDYV